MNKFEKVYVIKRAPDSIAYEEWELESPLYPNLQGTFDSEELALEAIEDFYQLEPVFTAYFILPCYVLM